MGLSVRNQARTGIPIFGSPSSRYDIGFVHTPSISTEMRGQGVESLNSAPGYSIVVCVKILPTWGSSTHSAGWSQSGQ